MISNTFSLLSVRFFLHLQAVLFIRHGGTYNRCVLECVKSADAPLLIAVRGPEVSLLRVVESYWTRPTYLFLNVMERFDFQGRDFILGFKWRLGRQCIFPLDIALPFSESKGDAKLRLREFISGYILCWEVGYIYAFVPGRTRLSFFFSLTYVLPDIMKVTCMYACIHVCLCTVDAFLSTLYVYIARVYVCLPVCLSNYV